MGAVNLDNTGSGAAITLSSDGTDLLLDGTPIGGGGSSTLVIDNKTAAYTVVAGDLGKIINCTANIFTISLTAAATLGAGFNVTIWNTSNTASHVITIDPNGTETIDGSATLVLRRGEGLQIVCAGTNWQTGDKKTMRGYAESLSSGNQRPLASGTNAVAIHSFATASGANSLALGQFASASAQGATAIGTNSNVGGSQAVTGAGAMALGGSYASGVDSFAAAIANNTSTYGATGANSVAIGQQAKASGANSISLGGISGATSLASNTLAVSIGWATASGSGAVAIGNNTQATATQINSVAISGNATATYSTAIGKSSDNSNSGASGSGAVGLSGGLAQGQDSFAALLDARSVAANSVAIGSRARANQIGKYVFANGRFAAAGDVQTGTFVLRSDTTDATPEALTTDNSAPGTTDQVILPNNSAYAFSGTIIARQKASDGTASAAWKVEGLIRREGTAASTTLVASTVTAIDNTPGWALALSADTTNGGLKVEATGAAATNIRWVATIQTSEVTYA